MLKSKAGCILFLPTVIHYIYPISPFHSGIQNGVGGWWKTDRVYRLIPKSDIFIPPEEISTTHSRSDVCAGRLFPSKDLDKTQVRPRWSHISLKKVNSSHLFWRWKQWLLYLPSWESPLGETHTVLVFIQVAHFWPQDILSLAASKDNLPLL